MFYSITYLSETEAETISVTGWHTTATLAAKLLDTFPTARAFQHETKEANGAEITHEALRRAAKLEA